MVNPFIGINCMHTAICLMIFIMLCDVMISVFRLRNTTDLPPVSRTKKKRCNSFAYKIITIIHLITKYNPDGRVRSTDVITYGNDRQASEVSRSIESLSRRRYTQQLLHSVYEQSVGDSKLSFVIKDLFSFQTYWSI